MISPLFSILLSSALLFIAPLSCSALYSKGDGVVQISGSSDFSKKVLKYPGISIVEFYAPWCGHCKNLSPEYKKAAKALKGVARVVAVDATTKPNEPLAGQYGVQGFPTLKIFSNGKQKDFQGQRTANAIVKEVMNKVKSLVNTRIGGKAGSGGGGRRRKTSSEQARGGGGSGEFSGANVFQLNSNNWEKSVVNSPHQWMVAFYAPWCGHCKKLSPEWNEAAEQLARQNPNIKLGAVDATQDQQLAQQFGVRGYPTIKFFAAGKTGKAKRAEDYNGPREAQGIAQFALQKFSQSGFKMEIPQLLTDKQFKDTCEKLCILAVLPPLFEGGKRARDNYIKVLEDVANKSPGPFSFAWVAAGDHPVLEKQLKLTFGFPAIVSLSLKRGAFSMMMTAYEMEKISHYLLQITAGRGRGIKSHKLESEIKLETVAKWNGKDGPKPEPIEEEFDLADIMGDDEL